MVNNSLVLLNYNDSETATKFLETIKNYTVIDSVVVIDNNSTDNSYEILKKFASDKIKVIKSNKNGGYAYGNNLGIKCAEKIFNPKYIIISNPDVFFTEDLIIECIKYLENDKMAAIATGKMFDKNNRESKVMAWKIPSFWRDIQLSLMFANKFYGNKLVSYDKEYLNNEKAIVEVVPGSFFVIKSDIMRKINYFDEDTFLYCEERILAHKIKNIGYYSVLLGNSKYFHYHGKTIKKNISRSVKQYSILQDSKRLFLKKYLGVSVIKLAIFDIVTILGKLEYLMLDGLRNLKSKFHR